MQPEGLLIAKVMCLLIVKATLFKQTQLSVV